MTATIAAPPDPPRVAPSAAENWTVTDIRELCRVLRGSLDAGCVPDPGAVPAEVAGVRAPLLRSWLVAVADEAVGAGALARRARDAWVAAEGLTGRCRSRSGIAAALRVSPSRLDQLRAAAARAVATVAASGVVPLPREPDAELPAEWALAQVHAEVAIADPGDAAAAEAVRVLRHRVLDELPRSQPRPPATDAERAARCRSRRALEARLEQQRLAPVRLPLRLLADGCVADPDQLQSIVERGEEVATVDPAASRELSERAVRGYASFEVPPDPHAEARAWRLAVHHDVRARDMAAVWRAQRVARLLGPAAPAAVESLAGAAVVMRAHGYLQASDRLACRLLRDVPDVHAAPAERDRLAGALLWVFGAATPWSASGELPAAEVERARLRCAQHLQLLQSGAYEAGPDEWLAVRRRELLCEHGAAVLAARAEGARRPAWSADFRRRLAALHDDSAAAGPQTRIFSALTGTRLCADRGDRDGFVAGFAEFLTVWRGELPSHNFRAEEAGFRSRAARFRCAELLPA
jgi:hypothetical protein